MAITLPGFLRSCFGVRPQAPANAAPVLHPRSVSIAEPAGPRAPARDGRPGAFDRFTSWVSRTFRTVVCCGFSRNANQDNLSTQGGTPRIAAADSSYMAPVEHAAPAAIDTTAALTEVKPAAGLTVGQHVLFAPDFGAPKSAVIAGFPNKRFVTIHAQDAGQQRVMNVEHNTLQPWTEDSQRLLDAAAEAAPAEESPPVLKAQAPPLPNIPRTQAEAVAAHALRFPPVKVTDLVQVEANRRIGAYVKLGQTDATMIQHAFGNWTDTPPDELVLQEHVRAVENVPPRDMALIHDYVLNNSRNRELREGKVSEFNRDLSAVLHRVSLPLPAGTELKRNLKKFADKDALRNLPPGTIVQSPQFDSLAFRGGNYGEPGHWMGQSDHEVQLRLVTSEGVRGLYIGKSSMMSEEEEVLLPENTRYAIHSVRDEPDSGRIIVEAVILPTVQGALE